MFKKRKRKTLLPFLWGVTGISQVTQLTAGLGNWRYPHTQLSREDLVVQLQLLDLPVCAEINEQKAPCIEERLSPAVSWDHARIAAPAQNRTGHQAPVPSLAASILQLHSSGNEGNEPELQNHIVWFVLLLRKGAVLQKLQVSDIRKTPSAQPILVLSPSRRNPAELDLFANETLPYHSWEVTTQTLVQNNTMSCAAVTKELLCQSLSKVEQLSFNSDWEEDRSHLPALSICNTGKRGLSATANLSSQRETPYKENNHTKVPKQGQINYKSLWWWSKQDLWKDSAPSDLSKNTSRIAEQNYKRCPSHLSDIAQEKN